MPACGGDLERPPGERLPADLGEVRLVRDRLRLRPEARRTGARSSRPATCATTAPRCGAGRTSTPGTAAASAAFSGATTRRSLPCAREASAIERTPGTGRTSPSRASSPTRVIPSRPSAGTSPVAARIAIATARSNPVPLFGRSAGARFTTRFRPGRGRPICRRAERIRSRLSRTAASGRPTTVRPGKARADRRLDDDRHGVEPDEGSAPGPRDGHTGAISGRRLEGRRAAGRPGWSPFARSGSPAAAPRR